MVEQHLGEPTAVVVGRAEEKQLGHGGMVACSATTSSDIHGLHLDRQRRVKSFD
jgi:hypothetical protein